VFIPDEDGGEVEEEEEWIDINIESEAGSE